MGGRPEHCQDYVLRLIHEIRKAQSLPPYTPRREREYVTALMHSCNICGHTRFGAGPNGRKVSNGMAASLPQLRCAGTAKNGAQPDASLAARLFELVPQLANSQ